MSVIILSPRRNQNGQLWFYKNNGSPSQPSFERLHPSPFTPFEDTNCRPCQVMGCPKQEQFPKCFDVDGDGCGLPARLIWKTILF